jgi:hypothetical protein
MSGEYINAKTIEDYWTQLKSLYVRRSLEWKDLTDEEYKAIERSEHEDSDNHFNMERLGKDTDVVDICHYKYMPERHVAYKIEILHKDKSKREYYFQIRLKEDIE